MEVRVSLLPTLEGVQEDVDVAIVIDVLRATSAITTALDAGARRIWTVPTIDEAFSLREQRKSSNGVIPLLCGERQCRPIDGFDHGNSPAEYQGECVRDRELIFSTTNGTRAIESARSANQAWLGSFLNRSAIVNALARSLDSPRDSVGIVHFVCSGTDGHVTREDVLLAGNFISQLSCVCSLRMAHDQARIAKAAFDASFGGQDLLCVDALAAEFHDCLGGRNLIAAGYSDDLIRCATLDVTTLIPKREQQVGIASFV